MRQFPRLRDLNPLRLFNSKFSYQQISSVESLNLDWSQNRIPAWLNDSNGSRRKCGWGRFTFTHTIWLAIAGVVLLALLGGGGYHHHRTKTRLKLGPAPIDLPYHWMHYFEMESYFNGVRALVPFSEWRPGNGYNLTEPVNEVERQEVSAKQPTMDPVKFDPYPEYASEEYVKENHEVQSCYLDVEETVTSPDVYVYPGIPQSMPEQMYGSYKELGLDSKVCFERYGRYGPYGFGYNKSHDGLGPGTKAEQVGSEEVWDKMGFVNYTEVDWGTAQKRCVQKNSARFAEDESTGRKRQSRQAYVLRTWTGYKYGFHQIYAIRAMISELNIKSGGEYDVHLLVHVKNNSIPIWADQGEYQRVIQENVPKEFWNISTLWSEKQMEMYYPGPFPGNFANMVGSTIHGVYRSAHFPLQWFAQQHPEYDHFWNWEMDMRYSGHYYDFHSKVGEWAKKQPRKGMWERSSRFYIPKYHGDWKNFTQFVEEQTATVDAKNNNVQQSGPLPIWGPVNKFKNAGMLASPTNITPPTSYDQDPYHWGVDEEADLLTFNPIFDPSRTNWVFNLDITGYKPTLPPPPRRAAIITVARLSKRLLHTMHAEVALMKHTMFPEMWPASVALHHGFKALYVPHPVFFQHDWDVARMDQVFNHPVQSWDSPFGWGEHNLLGSTFYYNSGFSARLWRRWLGLVEVEGEVGKGEKWVEEEEGEEMGLDGGDSSSGRMCVRPILHHPVKREAG